MLRPIFTNLQRCVILQSKFPLLNLSCIHNLLDAAKCYPAFHNSRSLARVAIEPPVSNPGLLISSETDGDYIAPYSITNEYVVSKKALFKVLRIFFKMTNAEMEQFLDHESLERQVIDVTKLSSLQLLHEVGVSKQTLLDYPWLIVVDKSVLVNKLKLIKSLNPRDINHFIAYMHLTLPRLKKIIKVLKSDSQAIPNNSNRIYYISEKLGLDPSVVSKYLSHRLFILEMPFGHLERNLQNMIDYDVPGINILRDLWAFRYKPKSVRGRLERARSAKKSKIMPWMVRCTESILERSLKLAQDDVKVFGEENDVIQYVAGRLNFDVETTKAIMMKHKQVLRVRGTKIKEVLDYLLDEAGFSRYEIAQVPRILCHGLETTKQRLEELKSYGCRPSTLVILCRSKREFEKFVQSWLNTHKQGHCQNVNSESKSSKTEQADEK